MKWGLVAALLLIVSSASAQTKFVKVSPGSGGDLDETRLYSVDFDCGYKQPLLSGYAREVYSPLPLDELVVIFGGSLYSRSAAAGPVPGATQTLVFAANVFTHKTALLGSQTQQGSCKGLFYINGAESYRLEGQVASTVKNKFADIVSKGAALIIDTASAIYPLVRATKPPEFDNKVNNVKTLLQKYEEFRELFSVTRADKQIDSGDLRIGTNWIRAYNSDEELVAWIKLVVNPVVSLVKDNKTKFLTAYEAASAKTAISISGTDEELRQRCDQAQQTYFASGIRDITDVAYLLYRRLLTAFASPEKIVKCMDREISLAALDLVNLKQSPIPASKNYRITQDDVDNYAPAKPASDQPHTRAMLADEMDSFVDILDRHLQSENGLRGAQLAELIDDFTQQVVLVDMTTGYKALKLIQGQDIDTVTLSRDDFLAKLRKAGILRWLCVQRTKRNQLGGAVRLYDSKIDSAVMVIAAKAGANEELEFNKSTLFGVHVLFAKAAVTQPLHINKMIFEQKYRDSVLKENTTCVKGTPTKQ
jgi:hypothetical protein